MTFDIMIRYAFLPVLGGWALYRLIREFIDYRRGQW